MKNLKYMDCVNGKHIESAFYYREIRSGSWSGKYRKINGIGSGILLPEPL